VDYVHTRNLQIVGDDGEVKAWLSGGRDGGTLILGNGEAVLNTRRLTFRTTSRQSPGNAASSPAPLLERVEIGTDDRNSAGLALFAAQAPAFNLAVPMSELKLMHNGRFYLRL